MAGWIVGAAALGSVAISALLAWVLWRINVAAQKRDGSGD
jgi:hypothetical protein